MENQVGYAKRDLVVPQAPFTDLGAANKQAAAWCVEVNSVVHSEICAVPAEQLVIERELLARLPSLRPSIGIYAHNSRRWPTASMHEYRYGMSSRHPTNSRNDTRAIFCRRDGTMWAVSDLRS